MNPKSIIAAILGNWRIFLYVLLIGGAGTYAVVKLNQYVSYRLDKALTDQRNAILSDVQKSIQESLDRQLNDLSGRLDDQFNRINVGLNDAKSKIENQRTQLDSIGDVWLRVDATRADSGTGSKGEGSKSSGNQSGDNGAGYAKLPATHVQFLKGEAYRADQCAVRLGAAQETLVQYKGAFEQYQQYVRDALERAKIPNSAK